MREHDADEYQTYKPSSVGARCTRVVYYSTKLRLYTVIEKWPSNLVMYNLLKSGVLSALSVV